MDFKVIQRDEHHWDIYNSTSSKRIFKIRGGRGLIVLLEDSLEEGAINVAFKTVGAAMNYVCDHLMGE